jgi:hypothetical protein
LNPLQSFSGCGWCVTQPRSEASDRSVQLLPPVERAAEFRRWAASHESGPGLPNSAVGRDAIYD